MAIKTHSCISVACDVCGRNFEGFYEDGTQHYDTQEEALGDVEGTDWCTTTTGGAVCDAEDEAHAQAAAMHHGGGKEPGHDCWRLSNAAASPETAAP